MKLRKPTNQPNFHEFIVNEYQVFFSYETPIAFVRYSYDSEKKIYISENEWSTTTGKHINYVKRIFPNHEVVPHSELLSLIELYR